MHICNTPALDHRTFLCMTLEFRDFTVTLSTKKITHTQTRTVIEYPHLLADVSRCRNTEFVCIRGGLDTLADFLFTRNFSNDR